MNGNAETSPLVKRAGMLLKRGMFHGFLLGVAIVVVIEWWFK